MAETVNADRHAGLDTVAALLLTGIEGGKHVRGDVTVATGGSVDVTVEVDTLCSVLSAGQSASSWSLANSHVHCDDGRRSNSG